MGGARLGTLALAKDKGIVVEVVHLKRRVVGLRTVR
jgi:hypothetical protein